MSSKAIPKLTLIQGDKDTIQLWPGNQQTIPLPNVIETNFTCHRCGHTDEFYVLSENLIHCFQCNLTSIQKHK